MMRSVHFRTSPSTGNFSSSSEEVETKPERVQLYGIWEWLVSVCTCTKM